MQTKEEVDKNNTGFIKNDVFQLPKETLIKRTILGMRTKIAKKKQMKKHMEDSGQFLT